MALDESTLDKKRIPALKDLSASDYTRSKVAPRLLSSLGLYLRIFIFKIGRRNIYVRY